MQYSDFQNQASSEKIVLATLDASKRLMGWSLHSGSVYKIENVTFPVIVSLEDSGNGYTEAASIAALSTSQYFLDRETQILYIKTTGSDNPNGRFLVVTYRLFLANVPVVLPHDLNTGFEVPWDDQIQSTSQFGVEIDTINQVSEAIEGSGTLTLFNDQTFWPSNFDKLYFENKTCSVYSYHRDLDATEAKLIYRGQVEKKAYTNSKITFTLKDALSELKAPIGLGTIADLGLRTSSDLDQARQRLILGRVFGHRPVNTDQVLDGYPISGTVSISYNTATLTGSGTLFLTELSPDDEIILNGTTYTIATVSSNTSATITENYTDVFGLSGASALLLPDQPKRWMNRTWHIAGHPLREPITSVSNGSSITRIIVDDATDIYAGDWIYVGELGSGELIRVESITGQRVLNLGTSLETIPSIGTVVRRPAVQNVRIDDVDLVYYQDYTLDAETATLTLRTTAESSASPIRTLTSNLVFNGTRTVTGTGLKSIIKPGYMVGVSGNAVFFEVLSVDSDTQLTLRTNATFSTTAIGRYKALVFDPETNVLSLDVLGKTSDGLTDGPLMKTAPSIVKGLITDAGLADRLELESFEIAESATPMHLGMVWPKSYNESTAPIYRDVINAVNKSVFGSLVQTVNFELAYHVLEPFKNPSALRLDEADILKFQYDSTAEKVVKTSIIKYKSIEYDYLTGKGSVRTEQKTSDISNYIAKSTREKTIETYLVDEADARRTANRWAFVLEHGAGRATITTKLQAMTIEVGSIVEIEHRKFFERVGLSDKSRLFLVEAVRKSGTDVQIEVVDLSNAFSRAASINTLTVDHSDATDREKLYGGFYTDQYGLIDNDPESFGTNLIW